jgi:hypothetical protein
VNEPNSSCAGGIVALLLSTGQGALAPVPRLGGAYRSKFQAATCRAAAGRT